MVGLKFAPLGAWRPVNVVAYFAGTGGTLEPPPDWRCGATTRRVSSSISVEGRLWPTRSYHHEKLVPVICRFVNHVKRFFARHVGCMDAFVLGCICCALSIDTIGPKRIKVVLRLLGTISRRSTCFGQYASHGLLTAMYGSTKKLLDVISTQTIHILIAERRTCYWSSLWAAQVSPSWFARKNSGICRYNMSWCQSC